MKVNHRKPKAKAKRKRPTAAARRARKLEDGWRKLAQDAIEEMRSFAIENDDEDAKRIASNFARRFHQLAGQLELFT